MGNLGNFDANQVEPSQAFDPIPAGKYKAMIVDSEQKQTKAGDGSYIKLEYQILDEGPYANRKIWTNLNLDNRNDKAREIAYRDLSAICRAIGLMVPHDSSAMHNIPHIIKVKIRAAKDGYEAQNDISGYFPLDQGGHQGAASNASAQQTAPPQQTQQQTATAGSSPPWKR